MGGRHGVATEVFPEFTLGGQAVRSSVIREMLARGDFMGARHLLGRPFKIGGHVVRGRQLGRKLGYPTANIRLGRRTSPVNGIFAVRVHGVAELWPRWPASACVPRWRASSRCWKPICLISMATCTGAGSMWSSSPSCVTRKNSTRSNRWSSKSDVMRSRRVRCLLHPTRYSTRLCR